MFSIGESSKFLKICHQAGRSLPLVPLLRERQTPSLKYRWPPPPTKILATPLEEGHCFGMQPFGFSGYIKIF